MDYNRVSESLSCFVASDGGSEYGDIVHGRYFGLIPGTAWKGNLGRKVGVAKSLLG